ncbi:UNVERIFIED_CONTAM: hypothetical protein PYX00_010713 [Menopon gallinae]|uniref:Hairy/enhancer-of-split related with YRPW motif protein n=1 Tax=Menopon gallinae TaxID=328185 RepID=A0AAW2HGN6_9NEOP
MSEVHNLWSSGGYSVNNPAAWAPPVLPSGSAVQRYDQTARPIKRQMSESDDCEEVFSEESSKDRCSSPSEDCQMGFSRKKRRGIIEKRRRDRINSSLSELRRLVPTAFEKQGSAKLEKAEILQMTVDHLKALHSKGLDALTYDPHKFAMDYHSIGFRECAAEVARYLVTVEGMDIQDPLRLRLMSHLQCFAAQRELASKQAATPWNYNSYGTIHDYPTSNTYDVASTQHHQPLPHHVPSVAPGASTHLTQPVTNRQTIPMQTPVNRLTPQSAEAEMSRQQTLEGMSPSAENSRQIQSGLQPNYQHNTYQGGFAQQGYNTTGQVKPYRPWGAEVAY